MYNILYNIDSDTKRLITTDYVDLGTKAINGHKYMTVSFEADGVIHTLRDVKDCSDADLSMSQYSIVKLLCSGAVLDLTTNNWVDRTPSDLPGDVLDNDTTVVHNELKRIVDYFIALDTEQQDHIKTMYPTIFQYLLKRDYPSLSCLNIDNLCEVFHDLCGISDIDSSNTLQRLFYGYPANVKEYIKTTYPPVHYNLVRGARVLCTKDILKAIELKVSSQFNLALPLN